MFGPKKIEKLVPTEYDGVDQRSPDEARKDRDTTEGRDRGLVEFARTWPVEEEPMTGSADDERRDEKGDARRAGECSDPHQEVPMNHERDLLLSPRICEKCKCFIR